MSKYVYEVDIVSKIVGLSPAGDASEGVYRVASEYFKSLADAEAMPIMLSPTGNEKIIEKILDMCDGILLTGGPDIDPILYGEGKIEKCDNISHERDRFELLLAKMAVEKNKPVLAICRGVQVLNVAFGGSLWQDIPSQMAVSVQHQTENEIKAEHTVRITDDSFFDTIEFTDKEFCTNSFHHQSVKHLADGFRVMAICAEDSVIEGIYHPAKRFVVGVQWHPERMSAYDENARRIFEAFARSL